MAEGDGLLNRCTALKPYRGFESLRLRFSFVGVERLRKGVLKNLKNLKDFFEFFDLVGSRLTVAESDFQLLASLDRWS